MMNRRQLLLRGTLAFAALGAGCRSVLEAPEVTAPAPPPALRPLVISTWPFGKPANERALAVIESGGTGLDAVVEGISVTESDLTNTSVGAGGLPNAEGVVQLDACIMSGPGHRAGAVAALENVEHPIQVARRVLEKTPHVLLVGDGARRFALREGFAEADLGTPEARAAWRQWKERQAGAPNHDTIALLVLMPDGSLFGGCSTSGLAYKLPGRVGDSPIIGSGLYVDDDVGAAGSTGIGENVMRFCGSFQVVELMRKGATPEEACAETIRRIARKSAQGEELGIHFLALDKQGRFGAAGVGKGFDFAIAHRGASFVQRSAALGDPRS